MCCSRHNYLKRHEQPEVPEVIVADTNDTEATEPLTQDSSTNVPDTAAVYSDLPPSYGEATGEINTEKINDDMGDNPPDYEVAVAQNEKHDFNVV